MRKKIANAEISIRYVLTLFLRLYHDLVRIYETEL